jgi:hypothetical protein
MSHMNCRTVTSKPSLALGVPEEFLDGRVWVALKERFEAGPGKLGLVGFAGVLRGVNEHAFLVETAEAGFLGPAGPQWIPQSYVAAVTSISAIERPSPKLIIPS